MSLASAVVRLGTGWPEGSRLRSWSRELGDDVGAVVVWGPGDGPDEGPEHSALVSALADALAASGCDAVSASRPIVDALVDVDATGVVRRHLDRDAHAVLTTPQVVRREWWDRLVLEASAPDGGTVDPARAVAGLGGRVGLLPEGWAHRP